MTHKLLYLSRKDVEAACPDPVTLIDCLETVFREKGEGRVDFLPKCGLHPGGGDNFIHAMPGGIPALKSLGIKWISGFPANKERGIPYISGLIILNHPDTGLPMAVMDAVWLTGKRTGAASALSARYLARPDSSTVGILGCGVQGRTNLEALSALFPLKTVRAYDVDTKTRDQYIEEIADSFAVEALPVQNPRQAVSGCDLVVTAGPLLRTPHETIRAGWMDPGTFVSMVDYDSYVSRAALAEADKFCTDDIPQLRQAQQTGYFQNIPPVHADLGDLVTGRRPGRETPKEITIAANLGLALSDMAAARLVYIKARESGLGIELDL